MGNQLKAVRQLHQLAQVHNADAVGDMLDDAEVVGDKEIGKAHFPLQILEHIHHLGLDGNIQGGNRLIADDELRTHRQGPRDAHPLPLPAGKLVGVAVGVLAVQAHPLQKGDNALPALLLTGAELVDINGFPHNIPNGHAGVQAGVGVLEDDLHLPAEGEHIHGGFHPAFGAAVFIQNRASVGVLEGAPAAVVNHFPVVEDAAVGGLVEAEHGPAHGGLAAAGFSHQPQGLPLADEEGDVVHRLDPAALLAPSSSREILLEMLDFN